MASKVTIHEPIQMEFPTSDHWWADKRTLTVLPDVYEIKFDHVHLRVEEGWKECVHFQSLYRFKDQITVE